MARPRPFLSATISSETSRSGIPTRNLNFLTQEKVFSLFWRQKLASETLTTTTRWYRWLGTKSRRRVLGLPGKFKQTNGVWLREHINVWPIILTGPLEELCDSPTKNKNTVAIQKEVKHSYRVSWWALVAAQVAERWHSRRPGQVQIPGWTKAFLVQNYCLSILAGCQAYSNYVT